MPLDDIYSFDQQQNVIIISVNWKCNWKHFVFLLYIIDNTFKIKLILIYRNLLSLFSNKVTHVQEPLPKVPFEHRRRFRLVESKQHVDPCQILY